MWQRRVADEEKRRARESRARSKEQKLCEAELRTDLAEHEVNQLRDILSSTLAKKFESPWGRLKDYSPFGKPKPHEPYVPLAPYIPEPIYPSVPAEPATPVIPKKPIPPDLSEKPDRDDPRFQPEISFLDSITPGRAKKKIEEAERRYHWELAVWEQKVREFNDKVDAHNAYLLTLKRIHKEDKAAYQCAQAEYNAQCMRIAAEHELAIERAHREHKAELARIRGLHLRAIETWEREKTSYDEDRNRRNIEVEQSAAAYLQRGEADVVEYCDLVLSASDYPDYFPQDFELDYVPESRVLLVDYSLPRIDDLPCLKSVKYNQSQDKFVEARLSESALNKLYEDVTYQVALRTFFGLFRADEANALEAVVFNGYVETIDKSTGQNIKPCVMSAQVSKAEFNSVNLQQVDPKACFKKLKGVSTARIHALAAGRAGRPDEPRRQAVCRPLQHRGRTE